MKLFNQQIHDELIALGYEHERYVDKRFKLRFDMYDHPMNDDWFEIDEKGHIDPADICGFTEGSIKCQRIHEKWIKGGKRGPLSFSNNKYPEEMHIRRAAFNIKKRMEQRHMRYQLDIDDSDHTIRLSRLTEH